MPLVVIESIPVWSIPLVDVASMMPVALVPGPSVSFEATLDNAPVMPLSTVPSVPGSFMGNPSPSVVNVPVVLLTPYADLWFILVCLHKLIA